MRTPVERPLVQFDDHCSSRLDRTTKKKTGVTLDIERGCSAGLQFRSHTHIVVCNSCVLLVLSLENRSFRPTNKPRAFYVQDYGDLDGSTGYWATEEETGKEGFVQEFEDTFWVHDEASDA